MAKSTLLDWTPKAGESGQRVANRALRRAFDRACAAHRLGKVREVLAQIASEAEAEYRERTSAGEPAPKPASAKAGKPASAPKRKGKRAKAAKAEADNLAYRCGPCAAEIGAGMRATHEATARHKRAARADA